MSSLKDRINNEYKRIFPSSNTHEIDACLNPTDDLRKCTNLIAYIKSKRDSIEWPSSWNPLIAIVRFIQRLLNRGALKQWDDFSRFVTSEREKCKLVKSYNDTQVAKVFWGSDEERTNEWDYAKKKLTPNGNIAKNGTKLSRVDPEHSGSITHSFEVQDNKIFAISPKYQKLGSQGQQGTVKYAEDEDQITFVRKLNPIDNHMRTQDAIKNEYNITKSVYPQTKGGIIDNKYKFSIFTPYMGKNLTKYMIENTKKISLEARFNLAINILNELQSFLHPTGQNIQRSYKDAKADNIVVDEHGMPHIIDMGSAKTQDHDVYLTDKELFNRDQRSDIDCFMRDIINCCFYSTDNSQVKEIKDNLEAFKARKYDLNDINEINIGYVIKKMNEFKLTALVDTSTNNLAP
jgi:hypothetical protein